MRHHIYGLGAVAFVTAVMGLVILAPTAFFAGMAFGFVYWMGYMLSKTKDF